VTRRPYSAATALVCTTCGQSQPLGPALLGCECCRSVGRAGALAVAYAPDAEDARTLRQARGFWSTHRLLPVADPGAVASLGEGETPLLPLAAIARACGVRDVHIKMESLNPTLSYKDRTNAVAVAVARQFGYDRVCCTSSGNHGVSLAAYAAAAGLRSLVLFPPDAPPSVVAEVRHYGGTPVIIEPEPQGGSVVSLLERLHREDGWFLSNRNAPQVTGRRFGNPFGLEGYKTIAYELWRQRDGVLPEWCVVPVGGGDGLAGVWRGFQDLVRLGLAAAAPRMVACQPASGASIVEAWRGRLTTVPPVTVAPTAALSLIDRRSGEHALRAVVESGGRAVALDEAAIQAAGGELGRLGLSLEPSSATTLAALWELAGASVLGPADSVVILGTGAGLRWPATYADARVRDVPRVPATMEAVLSVL
jgi:threonine synthase